MTAAGELVFRQVTLQRLDRITSALLSCLTSPTVIALHGTLGAGKTRFCQSLAAAAGIDPGEVTSPTFTLVQQYRTPDGQPIYHIDAYRLADEDEFIELGGEELLEEPAIVLVEWPERIAACLPAERLTVEIELTGGDAMAPRTVRLRPTTPRMQLRLQPLVAEQDRQQELQSNTPPVSQASRPAAEANRPIDPSEAGDDE